MKKFLSILLASIMILCTITACTSKTEGNGDESSKDTVISVDSDDNISLDGTLPIIKDPSKFPKMTMLLISGPTRVVPAAEMLQVQRLTKETGVEFDWQEIPSEGSGEKINLMLASNNVPDAFWNGITNEMIVQYMDQDIFIPTEELTQKYMKSLTSIYEKRPEYKSGATAPNGHRYGFPYIEEMFGLVLTPGPFYINKVWLDKVGKSVPTTVDEYVDCLKAFRDTPDLNGNGEQDEIPYSLYFAAKDVFGSYNTFHQFTACFGKMTTYSGLPQDFMTVEDDKIVFTAKDPAFKETARFFNMLNNEKLIDPDSFSPGTNNIPLFLNDLKGDEALIGSFGLWSITGEIPNISLREQYVPLPRLQGPEGKMGHKLNFSEMQNAGQVVITSACEYPEVIAAYVDYIFDPEMSITTNWGAIGYVYNKGEDGMLHFDLDENNNIILKDGFKTFDDLRTNSTPARGAMAILNEYYGTIADYTWDAAPIIEAQRVNGKEDILEEYTSIPRMLLTVEEQSKVSQIQPQIFNIVTKYTMEWVLDGNIDETWDKYINELENAGLKDLLGTFQGAYDRYLSNME